ncbi:hypothetical protein HHK36_032683 [Tetracentron sinense]|uniref:Uncharacterized protein n=1 Tax=Tetracentron sinense TaxID=13715 RepID=A0A834Y8S9_TETSI|nr:hypothetical protein HHK36_032683 [Tetracentron sinense]
MMGQSLLGNSVSVINLVRLASMVAGSRSDCYRRNAEHLLAVFEKRLNDMAMAVPLMCCAADMLSVPSRKQVVLVSRKPSVELENMIAAAHASYDPNKTDQPMVAVARVPGVIHIDPSNKEEMEFWEGNNQNIVNMAKNSPASDKVVALVCQNFTCSSPVTDPMSLKALLHQTPPSLNSCGLSPESALSASNKVQFETPERADSVLTLFKNHGFTESQISKLIRKRPDLLLYIPEKTLLPKLEFLFASAFRRTTRIFLQDIQKHVAPNIKLLQELGVPESNISLLITHLTSAVALNHARFIKIVKEVKELGFNPMKSMFVLAIEMLSGSKKSTRERKFEIYRRWGWSEDEILSGFRRQPQIIGLSDEKIMKGMDFFVNKMGRESAVVARTPKILLLSLEKRIIPRCSVIQALIFKGLIQKDFNLGTVLMPTEKYFLERYVTKYQEEVPQLLNVYQGKMDILELGFRSEEIGGMKQL